MTFLRILEVVRLLNDVLDSCMAGNTVRRMCLTCVTGNSEGGTVSCRSSA